ncbi:phosphoserine aminotransferase [Fistulina hepatica ATCC 64428]|nr:phosphoserine aminotransferase [Fistulina hepatica ATCC 64428]
MPRALNFGPGPSALPEEVLREAGTGLFDFVGTGIGIAEISHRSSEFTAFTRELSDLIRTQLAVPPTHTILFTQGGASLQFSAIVLNMLARHRLLHPSLKNEERVLDYIVTGAWSGKAAEEARRMSGGARVNVVANSRSKFPLAAGEETPGLPRRADYKFSPGAALVYYCENETVDGVQFGGVDDPRSESAFPFDLVPEGVPIVADYSSSFMSRRIPHLADHAVIYAGAQKNLGPAGLTVLIVREDCLVDVDAAIAATSSGEAGVPVPRMLSWKTLADAGSMYNTPPVLAMYITGLVLRRMRTLGGVEYFETMNRRKQAALYDALKEGEALGVVRLKIRPDSASWMNVVFDVLGEGNGARFVEAAASKGIKGIKGHRSVGGIRVSLYNAVTEEQTQTFIDFFREYCKNDNAA